MRLIRPLSYHLFRTVLNSRIEVHAIVPSCFHEEAKEADEAREAEEAEAKEAQRAKEANEADGAKDAKDAYRTPG